MIITGGEDGILVLLVEDDPDDYTLVRDLLAEIPTALYRLRWESSYAKALAALAEERPGVVLADYRLGAQTGLDLLQEVTRRGDAPPVILLTGQSDREIDLRAMEAGAADYLIKGNLDGNLLERSIRYSVRQHELLAEIQSLLLTDDLTGLHNRRGFFALAQQQLALARRQGEPCLLFFADLDNMKAINDSLGHSQGDLALQDAAAVLQRTFRASDILARIGGDEFAVLAMEADPSSTEAILQRLESGLAGELRFVRNGVELLAYLRRRAAFAEPSESPRPGLILLDLNMPCMDGREALREIKADPELRPIPVVVLTTSRAPEDVTRCYELGAASYIVKPVTFEALVKVMDALSTYWLRVVSLPE
jgi:two-component system cell cycle response regulator